MARDRLGAHQRASGPKAIEATPPRRPIAVRNPVQPQAPKAAEKAKAAPRAKAEPGVYRDKL